MIDSASHGLVRLSSAVVLSLAAAATALAAPPVVSLPLPANESIKISQQAPLSVIVADPDSPVLTVNFFGRRVGSADPADEFSVVALPDTQFYSENKGGDRAAIFSAQTDWVVAERDARNIGFVLHLGDISQNGDNPATSVEQWTNASDAMYRLENPATTDRSNGIPYVMAVGNHDQTPIGDADGTTLGFNTYFGVHPTTGINHFAGKDYYGGTSETSKADNNFCLVTAGGMDFIVISLEFDTTPDAADLKWADDLLKAYPARRGIVITHHMVNTGNPASFSALGEALYQKLRNNPNLILMHGGHVAGEGRRTDVFEGRAVHSILADYQGRINGGDGWLRIMKFRPLLNRIDVQTYSPTLDRFETDDDSQFSLDVNLKGGIGPFTQIALQNAVPGTSATSWANLEKGTRYEWYATVSDGSTTVSSPVQSFVTGGILFPPVVTLSKPANGSVHSSPATINLEAAASDLDGTVAKVEFYNGTTKIGEDSSAPYQMAWTNVSAGSYTVIAKAIDNDNQVGASLPIAVQVLTEPAPPDATTVSAGLFNPNWVMAGTTASPRQLTSPGSNTGDIVLQVNGAKIPFRSGIIAASNWTNPASAPTTADDNIVSPYQDASGYAWINNYDNSNNNAADANPTATEESAGTAAAFLPYAAGWTGASVAADGSVVAGNLPTGVTMAQADTGLYTVKGLSTSGNLLAFVNGNTGTGPDNVLSVRASGGIWTIDVRDNSGDNQDGEFSFVYVPPSTGSVLSGSVTAAGTVKASNERLQSIGVTASKTADYLELQFGDGSVINPANSALFLTADTGSSMGGSENIHSWSANGNRFRLFSQDLPQLIGGFQAVDLRFLVVPFTPAAAVVPVINIQTSDAEGGEFGDDRSIAFTVSRSGPVSSALDVSYTMTGAATAGVDTTPLVGTVRISAGASSSLLTASVLSDELAEGDETLELRLATGTGYTLGSAAIASAVLHDRPLQAFLHSRKLDVPFGDSDGDGQMNLLEYFMGSLASEATSKGALVATRHNNGSYSVRFPHSKSAVDVAGAIEWSTDLTHWFLADEGVTTKSATMAVRVVSVVGEDPEQLEAVLTFPPEAVPARLFARLAVTL